MRPIDADALKEYKCSVCENRERCEDRETVCSDIAEIDEQPTIEAEPVKRGRWEYDKTRDQHFCSMCGNFTYYSYLEDEIMTKYCPECSAEMDSDMDVKPAAKMSDTPAEQLGLAPAT